MPNPGQIKPILGQFRRSQAMPLREKLRRRPPQRKE
jgi:hypothetical protein